jgi:hypothetical protein
MLGATAPDGGSAAVKVSSTAFAGMTAFTDHGKMFERVECVGASLCLAVSQSYSVRQKQFSRSIVTLRV